MAVLPASRKCFDLLREAAGSGSVQLPASGRSARRSRLRVRRMPPFGNLYQMDVYVSKLLSEDEEIAFNAGSHTELMRLGFKDFQRLVKPKVARIAYGE